MGFNFDIDIPAAYALQKPKTVSLGLNVTRRYVIGVRSTRDTSSEKKSYYISYIDSITTLPDGKKKNPE